MRFGQETPVFKRDPNPGEIALWGKVRAKVIEGRKKMQLLMAGGGHIAMKAEWCRSNVPGYPLPYNPTTKAARAQFLNQQWNNVETCFAKVEAGEWGVFKRPDRADFDIIVPQGATAPMTPFPNPALMGFGFVQLLPVIIIVGRILLAAIIALIAWIIGEALNEDSNNKLVSQQIDADMAKQDAATKMSYEQFKQTSPFKDSKSMWESLSESAMSIGILVLLGVAVMAFAKGKGKASETAA